MTEETWGQFESRFRREGRDSQFNAYIAVKRVKIAFAGLFVPLLTTIVDWTARRLPRG